MREADLYAPVKIHLESCGYTVRGEVNDCDVVGHHAESGSLIAVELKIVLGLPVIYQALSRLSAVDLVYVAVAVPDGRKARQNWDQRLDDAIRLCRMLGVGFLSLRDGLLTVHADPAPYAPRKNAYSRSRLLSEFHRRSGDHNVGGTNKRPRITGYREGALRCARILSQVEGCLSPAEVRDRSGVLTASSVLRGNVYGWFENVCRGQYRLLPAGRDALVLYADVVASQEASDEMARTLRAAHAASQPVPAPAAKPSKRRAKAKKPATAAGMTPQTKRGAATSRGASA